LVNTVDALPQWRAWLISQGVSVTGPYARDRRISLYLRDPDEVNIEITHPNTNGEISQDYRELDRNLPKVGEIGQEMRPVKFNHATPISDDPGVTVIFFDKLLGLKNLLTKRNTDQAGTSILAIGNDA